MTYRNRDPWLSEDDLVLTKTLAQRIRYVRKNLLDEAGATLTQRAFAKATGLAEGHHGVMAWEREGDRGREPSEDSRPRIAALTGGVYRPEVFSLRGAEALVVESAAPRLRSLEEQTVGAILTFRALLEALAANGIQVPLPQAAVGFLATHEPATQATP